MRAAGADVVDVSAGQTSTWAAPVYGRMFQTPFSDRIRNDAGLATIAVGNITEADHANSILLAGRADLVAPRAVRGAFQLSCGLRQDLAEPRLTAGEHRDSRHLELVGQGVVFGVARLQPTKAHHRDQREQRIAELVTVVGDTLTQRVHVSSDPNKQEKEPDERHCDG